MARTTKRPTQTQNSTTQAAEVRPIPIPEGARPLLADLIARRDAVMHELSLVLTTLGAALSVPRGWTVRNLDEGFVPPGGQDGPARVSTD